MLQICVEYSYDAWGKCLSQTTAASCAVSNLADRNPLRYRGYYYDAETGWYYLQSRYYDPIVKRFINADSYAATGKGNIEINMFSYCGNNPVQRIDNSGSDFGDVLEDIWDWFTGAAETVGDAACTAGSWAYDSVCAAIDWTAGAVKSAAKFVQETFGFAVYANRTYNVKEVDLLFVGGEIGSSASSVVFGNDHKPIVFFAQKSSKWWRVWETGVGISVNIGNSAGYYSWGPACVAAGISINGITVEKSNGFYKNSLTQIASASWTPAR